MIRRLIAIAAVCAAAISSAEQPGLDRISADSLRKNLSYIASDELAGRGTPSHGLDLAADYIAAQFRSAGLEPGTNGSYFQTAKFDQVRTHMDGFELKLASNGNEVSAGSDEVRVRSLEGLDLTAAPVLKLPGNGAIPPIAGKVVAGDERRYGGETFLSELQARKPGLILLIGRDRRRKANSVPEDFLEEADGNHAPVIRIRRSDATALLRAEGAMTVSVHLARPAVTETLLRNVVGVLRGSDPELREQYLLLTAHYDHLGQTSKGIFNGANDNGSGTVSVIEIARALAALNPRPKRSILFATLFGEEEGLLGAYYYAQHPLVPLKNTIANVNLEQMGRTDEKSGREVGAFAFTGPSYSNLPAMMTEAAKAEGIAVYRPKDADDYFDRSDNYALALHGVIAHTIAVAFEYPDYHGLGDKVDKIDFANMAKVDRGVAAGIERLADDPGVPRWSDAKGAGIYREAGVR